MRWGMLAAGGVKGLRDIANTEKAAQGKIDFEQMRIEGKEAMESRIHERNRGEKVADLKEKREYDEGKPISVSKGATLVNPKTKEVIFERKTDTSGISDNDPAAVKTMAYVAKKVFGGDDKKAAAWYKQSKNKSPQEMASSLYMKAKSDPLNFNKPDEEIMQIVRDAMSFASGFGGEQDGEKQPARKKDKMSHDDARAKATKLYKEKASLFKFDKTQFNMSEDDIIDTWTNEFMKHGKPITSIAGSKAGMLNAGKSGEGKSKGYSDLWRRK